MCGVCALHATTVVCCIASVFVRGHNFSCCSQLDVYMRNNLCVVFELLDFSSMQTISFFFLNVSFYSFDAKCRDRKSARWRRNRHWYRILIITFFFFSIFLRFVQSFISAEVYRRQWWSHSPSVPVSGTSHSFVARKTYFSGHANHVHTVLNEGALTRQNEHRPICASTHQSVYHSFFGAETVHMGAEATARYRLFHLFVASETVRWRKWNEMCESEHEQWCTG